jgi:cytidylate kinase
VASIIITIDGPAGTGKSSVARELARRLGLDFLDTGAMYRAAAAIAIDRGIPVTDVTHLVATVADADLHFDWQADPPTMLAWLNPIDHRIRDADVTDLVSDVAAIKPLREHMVKKQRIIGAQHPRLVTEGRDQGSVVFPDAQVKFYLDADPRIRAERRAKQRHPEGLAPADLEALVTDLVKRDERDRARPDGPLVCPADAIVIDTTGLGFRQVVDTLERHVRERVNL